ncbi:RNA-directed DNA polymerase, eukaryota, reverse transcriptase zinc-binding domain protein [Tanacetum coccineum]
MMHLSRLIMVIGSVSNGDLGAKSGHAESEGNSPSITLDLVQPNESPLALLGCYKDFRAISNAQSMCRCKGFLDVVFKYLGGLWVKFDFSSIEARDKFLKHDGVNSWFSSLKPWHDDFVMKERLIWLEIERVPLRAWENDTFAKICNKWGDVLFTDDTDRCNRLSKRVCIKSTHNLLVFATFMVTLNNVTYSIRVRELCKEGKMLEDNEVDSVTDSAKDCIHDNGMPLNSIIDELNQEKENTYDTAPKPYCNEGIGEKQTPMDSDPFGLEDLIKHRCGKASEVVYFTEFPLGFSPTYNLNSQANLISNWDGSLMIMGDFNEVREAGERYGSVFNMDYGPTQFRFFHSWLEMEGFRDLVADTWNNDGIVEVNGLISFKKNLQNLKLVIHEWVASKRSESTKIKKAHQLKLSSIDEKIDQGNASEEDLIQRRESSKILNDIYRLEAKDIAQKSKPSLDGVMPNHLSSGHREYLERQFSNEEIKRAIWNCSGDRAPGNFPKGCNSSFIALIPKVSNAKFVMDFCPISLIGCQYKIVGKILANTLSKVIGNCISPEQSTFIKGRIILDGLIILNEVMACYSKRKKDLMVFKVDFEKAFDSLRWDFLDLIMVKLGFVLVNGSPTREFIIFKGLRQGDPLSHFLFILAMKGLHVLTCKAESIGLFKGATFGHGNMKVFTISTLMTLKINVNKCSVLGIGKSDEEVSNLAYFIGCGAATFPFKYLGVSVRGNMSRCSNWEAVIQKFHSKLSLWKARLLSVGGRLSLIKSVFNSLPIYYMLIYMMPATVQKKLETMRNNFFISGDTNEKKMTWVRWKKCLVNKDLGGLRI